MALKYPSGRGMRNVHLTSPRGGSLVTAISGTRVKTWQWQSDPTRSWPKPSYGSCLTQGKILPVGPRSSRPPVPPRSGPVPSLASLFTLSSYSLAPATGLLPDPQTHPAWNVLSPSHPTPTLLHSDLCSNVISRSFPQLPHPPKTPLSIPPGSCVPEMLFLTAFKPGQPHTDHFSHCFVFCYITCLSDGLPQLDCKLPRG